MIFAIIRHFCYGLLACFIGGLPLGMINLSVINITLKKSYSSAIRFALGSSLVEILEASIAVIFGIAIDDFLEENKEIELVIFAAFVGLGIYFLVKKPRPVYYDDSSSRKTSEFVKGITVAMLNPQAIPFWLFALAIVAPYHIINFIGSNLYFFLGGVFIGKMLSLIIFAKGALYIKAHLSRHSQIIDRTMGAIFIIIGMIQVWRYYW